MTRRFRVRPVIVRAIAAPLVASLALLPSTSASAAPQAPPAPYQDASSLDDTRDWSDEIPAHVSVVDGAVELERDGQREAAEENVPLLAGDRLRTARGRAEVLFSDGSALALDQHTDVDLLSDALMRMHAGRVRLTIARGADDLAYRVDAAGTTTWLRAAGEYRIVVDPAGAEPEVFVAVLRGAAELESAGGRTLVRTGMEARANARVEPSLPYATNVAAWDAFDRWVDDQQRYRTGARSAQYLPAELRYYGGAFDEYGSWDYEQGYGYVWYPRVAADWRPYYQGGWSYYGTFGWTWVGGGRWTWPTHHYGRWGLRGTRWFWVPGRRWAPAWVSWASAPGYLGWCPLGFDNRPVVAITNITVYGGNRWRGWTVLPSHRFGSRVAVSRWAVAPHALNISGERFTAVPRSSIRPSVAVRQVDPIRSPAYSGGRYAVPRQGRPGAGSVATPAPAGGFSAGRPSNPVTRPSGADTIPDRSPGPRSAQPRGGSIPTSPPAAERDRGGDRPGPVRSATPRSRTNPNPPASQPQAGPSSGSSSGDSSGRARRRSISSAPTTSAPLPSERIFNRRPTASPYSAPSGSPSDAAFRRARPAAPRVPPSSAGASRWERSPRQPAGASEPRARSRAMSSAPRVERPAPVAPSRMERPAPSAGPAPERRASGGRTSEGRSAESRGQARSRAR